jgi:hypothetical protein
MKCRRVKKLLPLYVEGDLALNVSEQISAHLDWCGRCNWLADEFNESQSWLHTSGQPEFDQPFLNDFKSDVLRRIEETPQRPSLFAVIAQHWGRRQVLAFSGAIFIAIGMVVLYIYQTRVRVNTQNVETAQQIPEAKSPTVDEPTENAVSEQDHLLVTRRHAQRHLIKKTERARPINDLRDPALFFQANRSGEIGNPDEMAIKPQDAKDDLPEMLRIEIQTADPNIRIIWFTPRVTDGPQTDQ